MPVPKPKKGEGRHKFISRFVADSAMKAEFQDVRQRVAAAHRTWEQTKEKKAGVAG